MPYLTIRDLRFYYETVGDPAAPPLLIISGLSDFTAKCEWQTADLAQEFFVITFDNRGAGRSSSPMPGYTVRDMADDTAGLLGALGITSAHVFGFSLGGMIAQNLALNYPDLVQRLVLGCTTAGGRLTVLPDDQVYNFLTNPVRSGDRRQDFYDGKWVSVGAKCEVEQPDVIERLADLAVANPQEASGYMGQIQAVLSHDVADRMDGITMPALVLHGEQDRFIPAANGRLLAENIPGARLILYPDAGHLFFIEQAETVNRDIARFLTADE